MGGAARGGVLATEELQRSSDRDAKHLPQRLVQSAHSLVAQGWRQVSRRHRTSQVGIVFFFLNNSLHYIC